MRAFFVCDVIPIPGAPGTRQAARLLYELDERDINYKVRFLTEDSTISTTPIAVGVIKFPDAVYNMIDALDPPRLILEPINQKVRNAIRAKFRALCQWKGMNEPSGSEWDWDTASDRFVKLFRPDKSINSLEQELEPGDGN